MPHDAPIQNYLTFGRSHASVMNSGQLIIFEESGGLTKWQSWLDFIVANKGNPESPDNLLIHMPRYLAAHLETEVWAAGHGPAETPAPTKPELSVETETIPLVSGTSAPAEPETAFTLPTQQPAIITETPTPETASLFDAAPIEPPNIPLDPPARKRGRPRKEPPAAPVATAEPTLAEPSVAAGKTLPGFQQLTQEPEPQPANDDWFIEIQRIIRTAGLPVTLIEMRGCILRAAGAAECAGLIKAAADLDAAAEMISAAHARISGY